MKRVLLFIATNLAVMLILSIVLSILMPALGLSASSNAGLLLFSAVFGMGGSFISLLMSKAVAKRSVGAYVIESARETIRRVGWSARSKPGRTCRYWNA